MNMEQHTQLYQWSKRDKLMHLLPAIPLAVFNGGTICLLGIKSLHLLGTFLLFWVATNFAIVGICNGCPYRGGYCPGVSQMYFAPFLSALLRKGKKAISLKRSFTVNLILLGLFGIGSYIFALYWLYMLYWNENTLIVLVLLGCLLLHMPLSFFILCPKCSYNNICPMARVQKSFKNGNKEVK
jgi:hypothetical protein